MRYAITQRNTPQTHLKPRYTKELPVRACAEHAHAYACAGRLTLARFARSGAPGSLRCPSEAPPQESNQPTQSRGSLARFARSGAPGSLRCPSEPFRIGSVVSVAGNAPGLTVQPSRDPCTLHNYTHAPLQAVAGQLGASPQSACACSLCSLASLARSLPCGLCYAQPFACGSLLACCLRAPMRSRFARFVAALRSRSVLICFCPPLRLVGVALYAGAPAPLTALQASPALLRARAPAACSRCPRYARANRARCARGLHYVPPEYLSSVRGGLPIQSACRGAVALTADCLGNLPPRPIVLTSTCARAPPLRLMCASRTR